MGLYKNNWCVCHFLIQAQMLTVVAAIFFSSEKQQQSVVVHLQSCVVLTLYPGKLFMLCKNAQNCFRIVPAEESTLYSPSAMVNAQPNSLAKAQQNKEHLKCINTTLLQFSLLCICSKQNREALFFVFFFTKMHTLTHIVTVYEEITNN